MKFLIAGLGLMFGVFFIASVFSRPFVWRLGSRPEASAWLRGRLPQWLLARLEKSGRYDPELWIRFVDWISNRAWMAAVLACLLAVIGASFGLYD